MLFFVIASLVAVAVAQTATGKSTTFLVALEHHDLAAAEQLFWDIADPNHELYGHYMGVSELSHVFRPAQGALESAQRWLDSIGAHSVTKVGTGDFLRGEIDSPLQALLHVRQPQGVKHVMLRQGGAGTSSLRRKRTRIDLSKVDRQQVADPGNQRASYGIPADARGNTSITQLIWGPGTYGYSVSDLNIFYNEFNVNNDVSNVVTTDFPGSPGGDNFGEGSLDTQYISSISQGFTTHVSNTNTSESTEETTGFGYAFMDFLNALPVKSGSPPAVLSLSLGSLSFHACSLLCTKAQEHGVSAEDCAQYISQQRQVCMLDSAAQIRAMDVQLMKVGMRGTTVVAAAGDGGSHFSFTKFPFGHIGNILNKISCKYNLPTYPSGSPYLMAVGGSQWQGANSPSEPIHWTAGGAGFSWVSPMPAYQKDAVSAYLAANSGRSKFPSPGTFNVTNRAYPDVSLVADNVPIVVGGQTLGEGGTSCSAPEFAGFLSLVLQKRAENGFPPYLGALNTRMYQAAANNAASMFFDIVSGDTHCGIDVCCEEGFMCAQGWDAASGFGSPIYSGFIKQFANSK